MAAVGVWWRTLRHLKWQQIVGRAVFKLVAPRPDARPAPARRPHRRRWEVPAAKEQSLMGPKCWRFLNVQLELADRWVSAEADKLWLYNLHYFDDLIARSAEHRRSWHRALIAKWIDGNPPGEGTGWEPYPVSLRIVNWIKWFLGGEAPESTWLDSLAMQARWLRRRLEFHLLGNHLFANAKALIFAGLFFEGPEADGWLHAGIAIVERELEEQILADGGHFERSPMYHALALEDVLDLLNLCDAFGGEARVARLQPRLREKARRMIAWLRMMVHPDGSLVRFNDCSDGVAPSVDELLLYAQRLGIEIATSAPDEVTLLSPSGYVRCASPRAMAWLDVAPVGPDYLPGHAHADTLSFELSLDGARAIVNGGTSRYGRGPRRDYERSTAAHNTVVVDGRNSSETWSGFRVGRRAMPRDLVIDQREVTCSHDGYRFLPRRPVHTRTWNLGVDLLTVEDTISPATDARARYFLAADLHAERGDESHWVVMRRDVEVMRLTIDVGIGRVERVPQAQGFGRVEEVDCLVVELVDGRARTTWDWA